MWRLALRVWKISWNSFHFILDITSYFSEACIYITVKQVDLEIVKKSCILLNSYPLSSSFFMNASNKRWLREISLEYRSKTTYPLIFFSLKIRILYSRSLIIPCIVISFQVSVVYFSLPSSLGKSSSLVWGYQFSVFFSSHVFNHAENVYWTLLVRASCYQHRILLFDLLIAVIITKCLEVMKVLTRQRIHALIQTWG